jgi:hypothetical protein
MTPRPGSSDGGGAAVTGVELGEVLRAGDILVRACRRRGGGGTHDAIRAHFGFLSVLVAGGLPPATATRRFGPRPADAAHRFIGAFEAPVNMARDALFDRLRAMPARERVGVPDGAPDPRPYRPETKRVLHMRCVRTRRYTVTVPGFADCLVRYEDSIYIYRDRRSCDPTPEYRPSDAGYEFGDLASSGLTFAGWVHPREMLY